MVLARLMIKPVRKREMDARLAVKQAACGPKGVMDKREFEDRALPHLRALYGLALRLTGDASTAEDLVQETYLKGLQSFVTLRDPDRVRPWLFQILSRLVIDRRRISGREVPLEGPEDLERFSLYDRIVDEDPLPYSDRLHEDFLGQFRDEDVRGALVRIPEAYRVPLVLVYVEGLSYRELADVMGCPIGTVMSRLHRGRKVLERELWDCALRRGLVRGEKP
jgi:RNA polymerase sigma-70 factor (ECF subfamily)